MVKVWGCFCRKAEEANATRGEPLGLDRRHNRYWRLVDPLDCGGDPLAGCLVVECANQGTFRCALVLPVCVLFGLSYAQHCVRYATQGYFSGEQSSGGSSRHLVC